MIDGSLLWKDSFYSNLAKQKTIYGEVEVFDSVESNLFDLFYKNVEGNPEKIAVVDEEGNQYSFSEINKIVEDFTYYLIDARQVRHQDKVAMMLFNSIDFIVSCLAISRIGAILVPLPTKFKKKEVLKLIRQIDLKIIISEQEFIHWFEDEEVFTMAFPKEKNGIDLAKMKEKNKEISLPNIDKCDPAIIMFTSGTTGQSKGVVIKNYNIIHAILSYEKTLNITKEDVTVIGTPLYHITGLVALMGLFLHVGGKIYLHKRFNADKILNTVKNEAVTFIHASPTVFMMLTEKKEKYPCLPSVRKLACGSSNMPKEKIKEMKKWLPQADFHTIYGLTETTSPATVFPYGAADSKFIGASGIPIPGVAIKITDELGKELKNGLVGEIQVCGGTVIEEYYRRNSPEFDQRGWLKTGDLGYLNDEGYLYVVDRKKDMINCGGEKVWSFDIENEIYKFHDVDEAAVVPVSDEMYGEVVGAVIKLQPNSDLTPQEIVKRLSERIASYKVPRYIIFVEEIPKTLNSKIDKNTIKLNFLEDKYAKSKYYFPR